MKKLVLLYVPLCAIFCIPFLLPPSVGAEEYVAAVQSVPNTTQANIDALVSAGLNYVIVEPKASSITLLQKINWTGKVIASLGLTISNTSGGNPSLCAKVVEARYRFWDSHGMKTPDGYLLGDDLIKSMRPCMEYALDFKGLSSTTEPIPIGNLMNLENIGRLKTKTLVNFFGDDLNLSTYYYPLMCRSFGLDLMLQIQVEARNSMHSKHEGKAYTYVEAHQQDWYRKALDLSGSQYGSLYPDGQVVRMLLYYALASGSDGFFLYRGDTFDSSEEKTQGIIQTLFETKPLRSKIANDIQSVEFFSKDPGKLFKTFLKGQTYDLIFVFASDNGTTYYHPTTRPQKMRLDQLVGMKYRGYQSIYAYSPLGLQVLTQLSKVYITQDQPLILVGFKGDADLQAFALSEEDLQSYLGILKARAAELRANIQKLYAGTLPMEVVLSGDLKQDCTNLLSYIASLDEVKRGAWLARSPEFPIDGDIMDRAFYRKGGISGEEYKGLIEGQVFNFYY
jgi:hypothetical protein